MPLFRQNDQNIPDWCEMRHFEPVDIAAGGVASLARFQPREIVVATAGSAQVAYGDRSFVLAEGQMAAIPGDVRHYELRGTSRPVQCMRLCGTWGNEIGGCGVFRVTPGDAPKHVGDSVSYPKLTAIDSHYHDYDEYWIVLEGYGVARVGEDDVQYRPGDCIVTGTGHHHDIPQIFSPLRAVYFESTLRGHKRIGHLWNHRNGTPVPDPDRT